MSTPRRMADDASNGIEDVAELASTAPRRSVPTRRRRGAALIGVAVSLTLVLGVGGVGVATAHKSVTLEADGRLLSTGTFTGDVSELLAEQGIEVGEHDEVSPALDARLADGSAVRIDRAQAIDVVVDGEASLIWTTEDHAGAALAKAAGGREMAMTVSRAAGRAEIDLPLAGQVRIVHVDGEATASLDAPTPLQSVLDGQGLTLGEADEVAVSGGEEGSTVVTIVRWATTQTTESEAVAHGVTQVKSDSYRSGTTRVTTEGVDGRIDRVYEVTTRDGVQVEKKLLSETVAVQAVDEVTTVGTKVEPKKEDTASAIGGGVWAKLAQCESGGNPTIVSSNGRYHGLYQFTVSTWRSVGGTGLPSQASAAEQTKRAKLLQAKAGWGQWPACSRRLGLR